MTCVWGKKPVPKRLSYSETVQTESGQKTALSTNLSYECIKAKHRTTTRQSNHNWYHRDRKFLS